MTTLTFNTDINSSAETVWNTLWEDETYRKWTAVFMEGSHAKSTWNEGDQIEFLGPNNIDGMMAIIEKKTPFSEMSFKHLGEIKNGELEIKNWQDASERYFLEELDGVTHLKVLLTMDDGNEEMVNYFNQTFPKALAVVKQISEN